jgi:hypothetical protein
LLGVGVDFPFGLLQRHERLLDVLAMLLSDQARQHLAKVRVLGA